MNRLSKAAGIQQELEVYTVDAGDQVNAFALGGNTIVVYEELVNRLPKEEELAVVLAHETAHILGQHNADDTVQKRASRSEYCLIHIWVGSKCCYRELRIRKSCRE